MAWKWRLFLIRGGKVQVIKAPGSEIRINPGGWNAAALVTMLGEMGVKAHNFRPALEDIGEYLVNERIPNQFKQRGYPKRWAPLSPS